MVSAGETVSGVVQLTIPVDESTVRSDGPEIIENTTVSKSVTSKSIVNNVLPNLTS